MLLVSSLSLAILISGSNCSSSQPWDSLKKLQYHDFFPSEQQNVVHYNDSLSDIDLSRERASDIHGHTHHASSSRPLEEYHHGQIGPWEDWLELSLGSHSTYEHHQEASNNPTIVHHIQGIQMGNVSCTQDHDTVLQSDDDFKETLQKMKAKKSFFDNAREMGSILHKKSMSRRFQEYATPNLISDLLSEDRTRRQMVTRSLLLHRPTRVKLTDSRTIQLLPNEPIYHGWTKEDIVERLFEIMQLVPIEDVCLWWYDCICNTPRIDAFPKLFTNDKMKQEAGIKFLLGLTRSGEFWIKERKKRSVPVRC